MNKDSHSSSWCYLEVLTSGFKILSLLIQFSWSPNISYFIWHMKPADSFIVHSKNDEVVKVGIESFMVTLQLLQTEPCVRFKSKSVKAIKKWHMSTCSAVWMLPLGSLWLVKKQKREVHDGRKKRKCNNSRDSWTSIQSHTQ